MQYKIMSIYVDNTHFQDVRLIQDGWEPFSVSQLQRGAYVWLRAPIEAERIKEDVA